MEKRGVLVGVDVSSTRLSSACAILRKYRACVSSNGDWDLSLYEQDGRSFDRAENAGRLTWNCAMNDVFLGGKPLKTPRKRVGGKCLKKKLDQLVKAADTTSTKDGELFDRVLVDAECTTDGRAHFNPEEDAYKTPKLFSFQEERDTEALQFDLLCNGFRLVKPGGVLVYSTCSLKKGQNEDVVRKLLELVPRARLVALPVGLTGLRVEESEVVKDQPVAWRLHPQVSGTSGMFVVKLTKLVMVDSDPPSL
jgi:hypothetical protein